MPVMTKYASQIAFPIRRPDSAVRQKILVIRPKARKNNMNINMLIIERSKWMFQLHSVILCNVCTEDESRFGRSFVARWAHTLNYMRFLWGRGAHFIQQVPMKEVYLYKSMFWTTIFTMYVVYAGFLHKL